MRRIMILGITTTILLAIGVGAVTAALFVPAAPAPALLATGGEDTVRRFYAVANGVIATGDPAPIQAVVAPHFADAEPLPGVSPGRAGLEAYLTALHGTNPGMRLEIEELVAAGDRVVARVHVRNSPNEATLGGSVVEQSAPWGAVETFRVAGGRIVERRSDTDDLAQVHPLAETSLAFAAPTPRVVTIKRFTLDPGARWDVLPVGPRLLVLESGVVRLEQDRAQGGAVTQPVMLAERGIFVAAAGDRYSATNLGSGAARILGVTFSVPLPSSQWIVPEEAFLSGVAAQTLAGGLATEIGVGPATVTLGRATLGKAARLSLTSAAGPVLLAVDEGQVDLTAWGTAWVRRGADGRAAWTREATLAAGDGLLLQPDGLAALHGAGAGPVQALVLTVRHEADPRPGSPPP